MQNMSEEYILYDLPSKQNNICWSPNSWKGRAALNFKGVPYKTVWVPYTELQQKFDSSELGPHPAGPGKWADYTVPIVRFPDGALIMESSDVAKKLETCPGPSLRLDDDLQKKAQDISNQIIFPMVAFLFYRIYNDVITEEEKDWFRKDREGRAAIMLGRDKISLEDWEKEAGGKASFTNSEPGMAELSKFLKENKKDDGPFISGSEACYADLMVVGIARFFRQANDDAYEKLMESVEGLKELDEACSPWFQRNNY